MTDDLVKRLRIPELYTEAGRTELMSAAADRIEMLELSVWQLEVEINDASDELIELKGPNK